MEDVDEPADEVPEAENGALASLSQHGLETGERLLDWIEVGAVGREEAQRGTGRFDLFLYRHPFVARQVVHDDHVAGLEFGHQHLGDIGFEPVAVDRPVEHHRCDHAGHTQARDQRRRFAMTMREAHAQPFALRAPTMASAHVRSGPRLVDEHEALRIEIELVVEPALPLPQDVGPVLLDRVPGLFLRVIR